MDLYREQILDHYRNPRGFGLTAGADMAGRGSLPSCGDEIVIQMDVTGDVIERLRFEGHGCAISMAAASLLTEAVGARTVQDVMQMTIDDMQKLLGATLPPARIACGMLALSAVQQALQSGGQALQSGGQALQSGGQALQSGGPASTAGKQALPT